MKRIKEAVLIDHITQVLKTNKLMLVVKDNAYGFGLCYIVNLAKRLAVKDFAVKSISEGIFVRGIYKDANILILGKISPQSIEEIKKYRLLPTINDYDDYLLFKKHKVLCHLAIDTGMNRFGMKQGYLAVINDKLIQAIYTHCYDDKNQEKIKWMEQLSLNYVKPVHFGGSVVYGYTKQMVRVGRMVYEDALYFYGHIVNIKEVKKGESVGYDGTYVADQTRLIAICNIGYADGLSIFNHGRVFIREAYYELVGRCCMDHCFILIDDKVKIGDEVEFFGNKISEEEFCKNNQMTRYEMFLQINQQGLTN